MENSNRVFGKNTIGKNIHHMKCEDFTSSIGNFRKEADKNYILNQY